MITLTVFLRKIWNNRIEDCQLVKASQSIQCIRLRLDLIGGIGAAGGVQGLMITLRYGQMLLYAWLKKKTSRSSSNKLKWKIAAASVVTCLLLFEILVLSVNIVFIYSDIFSAGGIIRAQTFLRLGFLMISLFITSVTTACFLAEVKQTGIPFDVKNSRIDPEESVFPYSLIDDNVKSL